jgi:RHS repeat-associated protein
METTDANLIANTNRYIFSGKEKQTIGNLNYLDYINRMYDPEIGRWFVQDPLQEKYYSWSSYNYCMNNPVKYVDPDGKKIWISFNVQIKLIIPISVPQKVQYEDGNLYNPDGKIYKGANEYATKVKNDLIQLGKDNDVLKSRLTTLEKSNNDHIIKMTDKPNDGNNNSFSSKDAKNHVPTGSETKYNPDNDKTVKGNERTPRVGLAHELLGHGWDADQGKIDYNKTNNGIPMYEVNAVNIENKVRSSTSEPQRTTYGNKFIPAELLE